MNRNERLRANQRFEIVPELFPRTARELDGDTFRGTAIAVSVGFAIAAVSVAWLVWAPVSMMVPSARARIEATGSAHPLVVLTSGRLTAINLALNQRVTKGEVLGETDGAVELLDGARLSEQLNAQLAELLRVEAQIAAESAADEQETAAARAALNELVALHRQASTTAESAAVEAGRAERLEAIGLMAANEASRFRAESQQHRAFLESRAAGVQRLQAVHLAEHSARLAKLSELRGTVEQLRGNVQNTRGTLALNRDAHNRRKVYAPCDGYVSSLAGVTPGIFVSEGTVVGTVVPDGPLRAVAWFNPDEATGRIEPGQTAYMSVDGFSWTRYGTLPMVVTAVATDAIEGMLRVELQVFVSDSFPSLHHGLTGSLSVEVERVSPVTLALRAIGTRLMPVQRTQ